MTGRNAPCPCGSGEKYKKCCLPKDRAKQAQETAVNKHQHPLEETTHPEIETFFPAELDTDDGLVSAPEEKEIDPLLQRINAFWDDFMDTPYEHQWAATNKMLAEEPELCDGEMVFEIANDLFGHAIAAGEIDRYKTLLNQFEEIVPESYAEELHYILDWRIQIALLEGNDADAARYFYQFSPLAGDHLDVYYRIISALAYHGKLAVLHEGMRQARPFVADGGDLVPWAYDEYTEKLGDIETLHLLEQNPSLKGDDPVLQQRLTEYELSIEPELLSSILDYRTGRQTPSWTADDFKFSGQKKNDPAKRAFALLLASFTHFAHVEEGIPRAKVEMARDEISNYISRRHAGELDEEDFDYEFGRRPKRKRRKKTYYALRPDAKTLDRYMAQLMGFMSFRHYEAYALFELLPVWLRFLTKYELLDKESRVQIIKEMDYLKDPFIEIATNKVTDPTLKSNVIDWPYDFG